MTSQNETVAVCVVTHNSAADLEQCLASIGLLRYSPLELVIVDCASRDRSIEIARRYSPGSLEVRLVALDENIGFAGGMNRALQETTAPFVLTLNPDARPTPDFVDALVERAEDNKHWRVGAVAGRLIRPLDSDGKSRLDACGMKLIPTWRHLDRGSGSLDAERWMQAERVFGTTAAAALYKRAALDDVAVEGEVFAAEFHSYREDAELCFRLREREWEIVYEPKAICEHRRANLPSRRPAMSAEINQHSLKNRYLLRAYHQGLVNFVLTFLPTISRDVLAFFYVLVMEPSSLDAYRWLWHHRHFILRRRRLIRGRCTCQSWDINQWFFRRSLPL